MSVTVTFEYDLHYAVEIIAIQTKGIVKELIKEHHGIRYSVIYWNDGKREVEYCFPEELRKIQ